MNWISKIPALLGLFLLLIAIKSNAQTPTVGLRYHDSTAFDGYTLFSPEKNTSVFLINSCGEKINEWNFTERPGATCYLLNNGNLLRAGKDSLEIRDWNNALLWSYAMSLNGYAQHHDIEPLPNGNILCVLTDQYTRAQAIAFGRDSNLSPSQFKMDRIIELQPVGSNSANLVWDWRYMDHVIQEDDSSLNNYGLVAQHPELLDINYDNQNTFDFTHVNAIDYNANLDQILLSPRHLDEIHIIDHSTTLQEAAGHTGGNAGKGGDILWRWGNPQVYQHGGLADQKLIGQHDSKWVENGYLDAGKISVFNNDGDTTGTFSSVHIINPSLNNFNYVMQNNQYLPASFDWTWSGSILGRTLFESKKSGGHALPNGNFVICETAIGQITEVSKSGTVLWVYKNPSGTSITAQDSIPGAAANSIFRGEKYPKNHPAFANVSISFNGTIENRNSISDLCKTTGIEEQFKSEEFGLINPSRNSIRFQEYLSAEEIIIYDLKGRIVKRLMQFKGNHIDMNNHAGLFVIQIFQGKKVSQLKAIVQH